MFLQRLRTPSLLRGQLCCPRGGGRAAGWDPEGSSGAVASEWTPTWGAATRPRTVAGKRSSLMAMSPHLPPGEGRASYRDSGQQGQKPKGRVAATESHVLPPHAGPAPGVRCRGPCRLHLAPPSSAFDSHHVAQGGCLSARHPVCIAASRAAPGVTQGVLLPAEEAVSAQRS